MSSLNISFYGYRFLFAEAAAEALTLAGRSVGHTRPVCSANHSPQNETVLKGDANILCLLWSCTICFPWRVKAALEKVLGLIGKRGNQALCLVAHETSRELGRRVSLGSASERPWVSSRWRMGSQEESLGLSVSQSKDLIKNHKKLQNLLL